MEITSGNQQACPEIRPGNHLEIGIKVALVLAFALAKSCTLLFLCSHFGSVLNVHWWCVSTAWTIFLSVPFCFSLSLLGLLEGRGPEGQSAG